MTFSELYDKLSASPHSRFLIFDKMNGEFFSRIDEIDDGKRFVLSIIDGNYETEDDCFIEADAKCEVWFYGSSLHPADQHLVVCLHAALNYTREFQITALTCPIIEL
jgi:hypothetical protein